MDEKQRLEKLERLKAGLTALETFQHNLGQHLTKDTAYGVEVGVAAINELIDGLIAPSNETESFEERLERVCSENAALRAEAEQRESELFRHRDAIGKIGDVIQSLREGEIRLAETEVIKTENFIVSAGIEDLSKARTASFYRNLERLDMFAAMAKIYVSEGEEELIKQAHFFNPELTSKATSSSRKFKTEEDKKRKSWVRGMLNRFSGDFGKYFVKQMLERYTEDQMAAVLEYYNTRYSPDKPRHFAEEVTLGYLQTNLCLPEILRQ